MPIQALKSQNLIPLNFALKEKNYENDSHFSYQNTLAYQNQNFQKQIDHFLKFSKMASSQPLSPALNVLDTKSSEESNKCPCIPSEENKPISQILDKEGRVIQFVSSDGILNYKIDYKGAITTVTNELTGEIHLQETDEQGRVIREVFPCGLEIFWKFDKDLLSEVILPDQSKVVYQYVDENHVNISRLDPNGEVQYTHAYDVVNDALSKETLIGKAGTLQRQYDGITKTLTSEFEYLTVIDQYDGDQNLISKILKDLIENKTSTTLNYPIGDLLAGKARQLDDQGRVIHYNGITCSYDEKGRLTKKVSEDQTTSYGYDAFDRLISVETGNKKVEYTYDLSGRRLSKTVTENGEAHKEFYLYQGVNQIGVANENKELTHLRVFGAHFHSHLPLAIAIESQGKTYAPIYSSNFNILQLVDKDSKEAVHYESLNPFGENLQNLNPVCPWIFATKYYDVDTGLVDFGDRQYDPSIQQWTSADSDPRVLEGNLYSYCNKNPLKYIDPDGRFVVFIPLLLGWKAAAIALGIGLLAGGTTIAADKAAKNISNKELALAVGGIGGWAAGAAINKIKDMPFPDRPLPQDEHGVKVPDTTDPHTQLGQRDGEKGKYPQAREFDENGQPVRDIDFTDHGRPHNHPIPHQHQWKDNPTGGTKIRDKKAEPVPEWNYEED